MVKKTKKGKGKKIEDISNKALAGLLIAAIVISVSGTLMVVDRTSGITGFATQQNGTASVNITGVVSIKLNAATITFGNGAVTAGQTYCNLTYESTSLTYAPALCGSWPSATGDIRVENDGNVYANVSIRATSNAASFIGGTSPAQFYKLSDYESGACTGEYTSYTTLGTAATQFCGKLGYASAEDEVRFNYKLTIPSDAVGYKTNKIIFEAAQWS